MKFSRKNLNSSKINKNVEIWGCDDLFYFVLFNKLLSHYELVSTYIISYLSKYEKKICYPLYLENKNASNKFWYSTI